MNGFGVLLVANRGEIARRVFRTGRAMGMRCVAVYVDADADAPFVADADEAIRLPAGGYLDGDVLLEAARRTGAEVIHPGYGFLSENAAFARQVEEAGIAWAGPTPEVIEAMGDKLAAKRIAVEAGVPTLPSVDDPAGAADVGYPLLVKAAAGGGGKGMRIVESADALEDGVASARREAKSGFGDDRVFLERYVARARHIEVQLLGDDHGNLVHFGERECSIQRRHQKIIEEAPSPGIGDEARASILESALTLGRALGYRSAGTVEFLYDDERDEHYFLEVNTRLQVEHPVTEEVTGIDLVREQLRVAAGHPLGVAQADVQVTGHAIEARLYAEDPDAGFLPATGTLAAYDLPEDREIRWENGVDVDVRASLRYPGFGQSIMLSMRAHPRQAVTFHGTEGLLSVATPFNPTVFGQAELRIDRDMRHEVERWPGVNHYVEQVEAFGRSVREGADWPCPLEFSRGTQVAMDMIYATAGEPG